MRHHPKRKNRLASRAGAATLIAAAACAIAPQIAAAAGTAPTITLTGGNTPAWSALPVTVTANATTTDPTNPVYETVCQVDQGAGTTVLGTQQRIQVTGSGVHIVDCWPIAWDGTVGATAYTTVQIDSQQPTVTLAGVPATPIWGNGSQTVTATASEPETLAGIRSVTCNDGHGNTSTTTGAAGGITISGSARYTVSCYATSASGVAGPSASQAVWVDNTAPTVSYSNPPAKGAWYNTGQPITVNVSTPTGVASIQSLTCDYNGQSVLPGGLTEQAPVALHAWAVNLTLPSKGSGTLSCSATDTAANQSLPVTVGQKVDSIAPTGVFVSSPNDPAVVYARVADNLSGVYSAEIQYQAHHRWVTLPTTLKHGLAKAVIPASDTIPAGKHPLRIVVSDNANNIAYGTRMASGRRAMLNYPVADASHLDYTIRPLGRRHYAVPATNTATSSTLSLTATQAAQIDGRLITNARAVLHGQRIHINVKLADGQRYGLEVTTNKNGEWSYRLPAGGDRTVTVTYPGTVAIRPSGFAIHVHSYTTVGLRFNPLHFGVWTLVGAQVNGGGIPKRGLPVIVQWRRNINSPWETFAHLHPSNADGLMRTGIPVPGVPAGTKVQVRAVVPATRGWKYSGASSGILTETVVA